MRESARNYDVGVGRADQEARFFEGADFRAQLRDRIAQLAFTFRCGCFERVRIFRAFQCVFHRGEIRIGRRRFLWPAITGGWLEIGRSAGSSRHAIRIGTVGIDIHIRLEQERFAMTLRVPQFQHGLAIKKVVARKKLIKANKTFAQHSYFCIVELSVKGRNRIGCEHRRQAG